MLGQLAAISVVPTFCRACGAASSGAPLCPGCASVAFGARPRCPRCGVSRSSAAAIATPCGRCLRDEPAFDATIVGGEYETATRHLLHALKFGDEPALARYFARHLADALMAQGQPLDVDMLVVMPLAANRLRQRGYNQSLLLARALLADPRLHRPTQFRLSGQLLLRVGDRPPQAELTFAQRRSNIKGVFVAARRLDGMRVALIDDVMTTGATFDEAARICKQAGAHRVEAWAALRTPL